MSIFPLEIFPGPLAYSVITSVWVGIIVTGAFNTRLGWVLSGLVVNGYIVPLCIVNPWVAVTIILESVVTYLLAYFYSEVLSKKNIWPSTFGRDRFFIIVLFSVLVRIIFGKILLPIAGEYISLFTDFDYANNLYSVGLVIVALTANAIWKPGVKSAILPFTIQFLITYIVIRYGLMELTNFSISNLAFAYEDVSTFIDSSPKSYFILLTAAFMASKLNLKYGWDFNGILIPSLLALQWYQPQRIVITFVEAWIVYYLGGKVLKLKIFKQTNLEGAPKIIIFYSISYFYKYLLTLVCLYFQFELRITDYYAYGYLISTLIALKMHDKNAPFSLPRICIQTSAIAAFCGVAVGFSFSKISESLNYYRIKNDLSIESKVTLTNLNFHEKMLDLKISTYNEFYNPGAIARDSIPQFIEIISEIYSQKTNEKEDLPLSTVRELKRMGYKVEISKDQILYLTPTQQGYQFGAYAFNLASSSKLIVEAPNTTAEINTYESGAYLFKELKARAFFAHQVEDYNQDGKPNQFFPRIKTLLFNNLFNQNYLKIRSLNSFLNEYTLTDSNKNGASKIIARHRLPSGLNLNEISKIDPETSIKWFEQDSLKKKNDNSTNTKTNIPIGLSILLASDDLLYNFSHSFLANNYPLTHKSNNLSYQQQMLLLLQDKSPFIADYLSEGYKPPSRGLTFLWDREIITEILQLRNKSEYLIEKSDFTKWLEYLDLKLSWLGYDLKIYEEKGSTVLVIFRELNFSNVPNMLGVYAFRINNSSNYAIESPRPFYKNNTNLYAFELFEKLSASNLLIAGAHPYANADQTSNQLNKNNHISLFAITHQSILRNSLKPILPVQVRGYSFKEGEAHSAKPILIANLNGDWEAEHQDELQTKLFSTLNQGKNIVDIVDGSKKTAGFENAQSALTPFSGQSEYRKYALIWVSPDILNNYGPNIDSDKEIIKFTTYKIPAFYVSLKDYLKQYPLIQNFSLSKNIKNTLDDYIKYNDVNLIYKLINENPEFSFHIIKEQTTGHLILSIRNSKKTRAIINLTIESNHKHLEYSGDKSVLKFLNGKYLWLRKEGI